MYSNYTCTIISKSQTEDDTLSLKDFNKSVLASYLLQKSSVHQLASYSNNAGIEGDSALKQQY